MSFFFFTFVGSVYAGDHPADVQDPGAERADPGLQPVRPLPGGGQVFG